MSQAEKVDSGVKGAVAWEDVLSETIKLASSSFGVIPGIIGIVAAPLVVALADHTVEAFKNSSSSAPVKIIRKGPPPKAAAAMRKAEDAAKAKDATAATELLQQAAAEGSAQALVTLALSLADTDPNEAIKLLRAAADSGDDEAKLQLALLLVKRMHEYELSRADQRDTRFDDSIEACRTQSRKLFEELCAKKNPWALVAYAEELIHEGKADEAEDILSNMMLSLSGFFRLAKSDLRTQARAAVLLCYLPMNEGDYKTQRKLLEMAAKAGDPLGTNNLAMLIKAEARARCRELLEQAAVEGVDQALANLVQLDREDLEARLGSRDAQTALIDRYAAKLLNDHLYSDLKQLFIACEIMPGTRAYRDFFERRIKLWTTKGYKGVSDSGERDPDYCGSTFAGYLRGALNCIYRVVGQRRGELAFSSTTLERIGILNEALQKTGTLPAQTGAERR